ncbi:MAG: hypothetical protein NBV67_04305 [Tagaea sp.]|nr:hypothetical protein [Tagaea sp.]
MGGKKNEKTGQNSVTVSRSNLVAEMRAFSTIATSFVDAPFEAQLNQTASQLEMAFERASKAQSKTFEWRVGAPESLLYTIWNAGSHTKGKSKFELRAGFCWWMKLKSTGPGLAELVAASLDLSLGAKDKDEDEGVQKLWEFGFDVQAPHGPGALFHFQQKNPKNHKDVDVPRFPILWSMPTDCLDIVFAELFGDHWRRMQNDKRDASNTLRAKQLARFRQTAIAFEADIRAAKDISAVTFMTAWRPALDFS